MNRTHDVYPIKAGPTTTKIEINDKEYQAAVGETVLSTLIANNIHDISLNDHEKTTGAYCGMGVCFCCLVNVDGVSKKRACQTTIVEGMKIETQANRRYKK